MTTPIRYVRSLDGLRGLAVLMVMLAHQCVLKPTTGMEALWNATLRTGWSGVDLFFVLSGFLITSILLKERGSSHYYLHFYMRRALRIVPLYYCLLLSYFVLVPRLPHSLIHNLEPFEDSTLWFWGFLSNFLVAAKGHWIQPPLSPSWSLAIEEQFYLLWPFVIATASNKSLKRVCLAVIATAWITRIVLGLLGVNAIAIYVLPITRADTIALGALIALLHFENSHVLERWTGRVLPLLGVAAAIGLGISAFPGRDTLFMAVLGYSAVTVAAGLLVMGALRGMRSLRFLETKLFVAIGKRSYAIYLLHVPVVGLLLNTTFDLDRFPQWPGGALVPQLLFHIVSTGATVALSYVAYFLVERHFLRLKRFFQDAEHSGSPPNRLAS